MGGKCTNGYRLHIKNDSIDMGFYDTLLTLSSAVTAGISMKLVREKTEELSAKTANLEKMQERYATLEAMLENERQSHSENMTFWTTLMGGMVVAAGATGLMYHKQDLPKLTQ